MKDQSPRLVTREVSALGRVVRTGPVYPSLTVYHCIFRTTAALFAGQGFLMLCVWLAAGGAPGSTTAFGRLLSAVAALLTAPVVLYLLSALVRYRGPAVVADRHGLRVLPDFLGPSEVQPWDEVASCYSTDFVDRFGAVGFRWTRSRTPLGRPLADVYRLDHRLLTTLLPVSADGLATELDALREHYRTEPTSDEQERRKWDDPHEGRWPYLGVGELPPRPDPATGVPLPPRAPFNSGGPERAADPSSAPAPPAGQSPALAWHAGEGHGVLIFVLLFLVVFFCWPMIVFDLDGLLEHPLFWGSLVGLLYWFMWIIRTRSCAAGADWLGYGTGWVQTYRLTTITQRRWFGDRWLRLEDSAGRRLSVKVDDLQENPIVWDLFYNGVLHSAIAGDLRASHKIHRSLRLPYPAPASPGAQVSRGDNARAENGWGYSPVGRDPEASEPVDGDRDALPREGSASKIAGDDRADEPAHDVQRPPAPWMAREPAEPDNRLHRGPTVPTSSTRVVGPVDRNRAYRDHNDLVIDIYPDR